MSAVTRPFYATADEVREMRRAAMGLTVQEIRAGLAAAGISAPRGLGSVRHEHVDAACAAFTMLDSARSLTSFDARTGSDQCLQHGDKVDAWPPAPETERDRLYRERTELREKILSDDAAIDDELRDGFRAQTGRDATDVELEQLQVASRGLNLARVVELAGHTWGLDLTDVLSAAQR